jgi:hypothetical protein
MRRFSCIPMEVSTCDSTRSVYIGLGQIVYSGVQIDFGRGAQRYKDAAYASHRTPR